MAYQLKSLPAVTKVTKYKPLKFKSNLQVQTLIDAYFVDCTDTGKVPTVTGLALALGTDRHTLITYGQTDEYFHTIRNAKLRIEEASLQMALLNKTNPAISIFNLKNNFGWRDKVEIESTNLNLDVEVNEDLARDFGEYLKQR